MKNKTEEQIQFKLMEIPPDFTGVLWIERSAGINPRELKFPKDVYEEGKYPKISIVFCNDINGVKLEKKRAPD